MVCPDSSSTGPCGFTGLTGIQQAIDASSSGDSIRVRAGTYAPERTRDVPFGKLSIRGAIVIDGKDLEIAGEPGALLDGSSGIAASAFVVRGSSVSIRGFHLKGFKAADPEDDIYDGHGIFFIDARGTVEAVTIEGVRKMGLTGRGNSRLQASKLQILDGHVGIWLEETAHLDLKDSLVRGNDSAGICTYGKATARIERSVFERNRDDGIYASQDSAIEVLDSKVADNEPLDTHAVDNGRIDVRPASTPVSQ